MVGCPQQITRTRGVVRDEPLRDALSASPLSTAIERAWLRGAELRAEPPFAAAAAERQRTAEQPRSSPVPQEVDAEVLSVWRERPRNGDEPRRAQPRRKAAASMQPGLRVSAKFLHDGRPQRFGGVILGKLASGWKVRFDDGEERAMARHSLQPEEHVVDTERVVLLEEDAENEEEAPVHPGPPRWTLPPSLADATEATADVQWDGSGVCGTPGCFLQDFHAGQCTPHLRGSRGSRTPRPRGALSEQALASVARQWRPAANPVHVLAVEVVVDAQGVVLLDSEEEEEEEEENDDEEEEDDDDEGEEEEEEGEDAQEEKEDDEEGDGEGAGWEIGNNVDARDSRGTWYEAAVVDERGDGASRQLHVHYNGWHKRHDEWVGVCSGRLRSPCEMEQEGQEEQEVEAAPQRRCGAPGCSLPDFHQGLCESQQVVGPRQRRPSARVLAGEVQVALATRTLIAKGVHHTRDTRTPRTFARAQPTPKVRARATATAQRTAPEEDGGSNSDLSLCFCGRDPESEEPWVQCDGCDRWCHALCAGFQSRLSAKNTKNYKCHDCNNSEVQLADARKVAEAEGLTLVPSSTNTTGFKGVTVRGFRFQCEYAVFERGETRRVASYDSIAAAALSYARHLGPEGSAAAAAAGRVYLDGEGA